MEKEKRQIKLLVGVPGVGKSTYIEENKAQFPDYTILALDALVEERRAQLEQESGVRLLTHDMWKKKDEILKLRRKFDETLREAVDGGDNILIDGIHDVPKNRAYILGIAKASDKYDYHSTAIIIHPPEEHDHIDRLLKRALKDGRVTVLNDANLRSISPVGPEEFDEIIHVGEPPQKPMFHEYHAPKERLNLAEIVAGKKDFSRH